MRKLLFIMIILVLNGCTGPHMPKPVIRTELTPVEVKLIETFTIGETYEVEQCKKLGLPNEKDLLGSCLMDIVRERNNKCPSSDGSVVRTAVGTAIGVGAVKLLMGK